MDSAVLGLGAVAWTDAWNAAVPEAGLRLSIDPTRLLELLRGLPVARALLSDLQQAESAGRPVQLIVSPDRQIAEIATGSGHYVLTTAARNSVLAAFLGRPQGTVTPESPPAASDRSNGAQNAPAPSRGAASPGVLWESPSLANRAQPPSEAIALPWLGADAYLEVRRDGGRGRPDSEPESDMRCATLRLQLPRLGRFEADIRVCGNTVAVSLDCSDPGSIEAQLPELQQRLSGQGLTAVHVGLSTQRDTP
jgi:flagellar hook-length control protein FliK